MYMLDPLSILGGVLAIGILVGFVVFVVLKAVEKVLVALFAGIVSKLTGG